MSNEAIFVGSVNAACLTFYYPLKLPPNNCPIASDEFINRFSPAIKSRWPKLVRAVGRALKIYSKGLIPAMQQGWNDVNKKKFIKHSTDFCNLEPDEIELAELFIIRKMQKEAYPIEYERLNKNKRISNLQLLELDVFMDSNEIMRINSRVDLPMSTYAQKLAPLVPRKSTFSMAFFDIRYKFKHVGIESQVAAVRSKYWMPQLLAALRHVKSQCSYCGFRQTNPVEYKMAPLPQVRTDVTLHPFEICGLDCAGQYTIYAKNEHAKKVWILIFTCTMSRFIHLYVLESLSSQAVFAAIMKIKISFMSNLVMSDGTIRKNRSTKRLAKLNIRSM
jgi:hypothetical protein